MKKVMYLVVTIIIFPVATLAQQSDFQTITEFQAEIEIFKHQIDNAVTSKQLENIEIEINEFQAFYQENKDLIDRYLYPQSMESLIASLQASLINNENRLVMIEHQREQVFELSNRLTAQRSEINRLYTITDSLQSEILNSQASEARLSEMISNYRNKLEQRDKLIFEMIDSLLITRENIVFQQAGSENQNYSISNSQNPLHWIETVLNENTRMLAHQNRILVVEDYIRMHALQQHFKEVWSQVGDDLITMYGGDQKTLIAQSIERSIQDWENSSTQRMWLAVDQYLYIHDIELSNFDSRESFYTALEAFIENGKRISESEILTTNGYSEYQKIADFWNSTFKNEWNLSTDASGLLSTDEV